MDAVDIEKLKKINSLAMELKKHGMVDSMDEAVSLAEDKIKGQNEISNIKKTLGDTNTASQQQTTEAALIRTFQNQNREQAKEINELKTRLNMLAELVNEIKEKQEKHPVQVIQKTEEKKEEIKEAQTSFKPAATTVQAEQKHPKIGGYNPDDVCVEKMFYCGVK